jgi:hypothetical protein
MAVLSGNKSQLCTLRLHLDLFCLHVGISSTDCSNYEFHTAFCFSRALCSWCLFSLLLLEFAVVLSFCFV